MTAKAFFVVWNTKHKPTTIKHRHENYDDARKEAERLADQTPGDTFVVLQSLAYYKNEVQIKKTSGPLSTFGTEELK